MIYECLVIVDGQYVNKQIDANSVEDAIKEFETQYGKDSVHFVPYKIDLVG
jgi:hypothetical protein